MENTLLQTVFNLTSGQGENILWIVSLFCVYCGMSVIAVNNTVYSTCHLVGLFLGISVYLIIIGYNFIGLVYLVVYVGAISILFLFIVMLIHIRSSESAKLTTLNSLPLALYIILGLTMPVLILSDYNISVESVYVYQNWTSLAWFHILGFTWLVKHLYEIVGAKAGTALKIYRVNYPLWDGGSASTDGISTVGSIMYTNNNIWLFISCYILLLAMVGCIVITKKKSRNTKKKSIINKSTLKAVGGVGATGGTSHLSEASNLDEAVKQGKEAEREAALRVDECERLTEQGKTEAAAEAAKDAQEWLEEFQKATAAIIYYLSNGEGGE